MSDILSYLTKTLTTKPNTSTPPDLNVFLAKIEETFPTNLLDQYLTPLNRDELAATPTDTPKKPRPAYDFVTMIEAYERLRLKLLDFRAELENIEGKLDPDNDDDAILYATCTETLDFIQTELDLIRAFIREDRPAVEKLIEKRYGDTPAPENSWRAFYR